MGAVFGGPKISSPPAPPPPPAPPNPASSSVALTGAATRAAAAAAGGLGFGDTLLTSGSGAADPVTDKKKLLGQ